jgi:hypothetical protein
MEPHHLGNTTRRTRIAVLLAVSLAIFAASAGTAFASGVSVGNGNSNTNLTFGQQTTISGSTAANEPLILQAAPYPYQTFSAAATATSGDDGSFEFTVKPLLNTQYRVISATDGSEVLPAQTVYVSIHFTNTHRYERNVALHAKLRLVAGPSARWAGAKWRVWFARRTSNTFRYIGFARLKKVRAGVFTGDLRVKGKDFRLTGFDWRGCVVLPNEKAWGPASAHLPCFKGKTFNRNHIPNGF